MAAARNAATSATAVEWRRSFAFGRRPRTIAAASSRVGTDISSIVGSSARATTTAAGTTTVPTAAATATTAARRVAVDRAEADPGRRARRLVDGVRPAALGLRDEISAVRADIDVSVQVGPKELGTVVLQPRDGRRRRMAIRVAPTG